MISTLLHPRYKSFSYAGLAKAADLREQAVSLARNVFNKSSISSAWTACTRACRAPNTTTQMKHTMEDPELAELLGVGEHLDPDPTQHTFSVLLA